MRRKEFIVTHIYAPDKTINDLGAAISHAEIWSNEIHLTCQIGKDGTQYGGVTIDSDSKTRDEAHYGMYFFHHDSAHPSSRFPVCVAMEPDWLINDPYIVRDAIELNDGATLFARRYMMVNEDDYRVDGIYAPIPVAVAYQIRAVGRFSSELNSTPDYAWTSLLRVGAPFDILDYQLQGSDTSGATIRSYEGMIPILKEHT